MLDRTISQTTILKDTLKQNQIFFFQMFRFPCHYLKIGGRKHPGYLKNEKGMSDLYENKKAC